MALSPDAKRILIVILDRGIVRGSELLRRLEKSPKDLVPPVQELVDGKLVEVTGELTLDGFPFATFGTRPSVQPYLKSLL